MKTMLAALRPSTGRSLSVLILTALLGATLPAQNEEEMPLPPDVNQRFLVLRAGGGSGDPGTDWSHREVLCAGLGLRTIMPIDNAGQSGRVQDVLRMAHLLLPVTVLDSTGQIGTWLANGTLYGVEFDVFVDDPQTRPAAGERLGTDGVILGLDEEQVWTTLGRVYCYDEAQYQARLAALGGSLASDRIWLGPVVHGAETDVSVRITGVRNTVHGDVKSNGTLRVGGDFQTVPERLLYADQLRVFGEGHTLGTSVQEAAAPLPAPPHDAAWYRDQAIASGTYFEGDLTIRVGPQGQLVNDGGVDVDGVVYATGNISIEGDMVIGTLTLVAEKSVDFSASRTSLQPHADDLLAWSLGYDPLARSVQILGTWCTLTGSLHAPSGLVLVSGSDNRITGRAVGADVKVSGDDNVLSDGVHQ